MKNKELTLKEYVKERDEMLNKHSVEALEEFIQKNKELYGEVFVGLWNNATYDIKLETLCKMILEVENHDESWKKWAAAMIKVIHEVRDEKLKNIKIVRKNKNDYS